MAYLTAKRYGLEYAGPADLDRADELHASGWRQVWRHPSGALAMRHPTAGYWVVSMDGGYTVGEGWSSSLRAASLSIERQLREAKVDVPSP